MIAEIVLAGTDTPLKLLIFITAEQYNLGLLILNQGRFNDFDIPSHYHIIWAIENAVISYLRFRVTHVWWRITSLTIFGAANFEPILRESIES